MNQASPCPECGAPASPSKDGAALGGLCAKCILRRHMNSTPSLRHRGSSSSAPNPPDLSDVQRDFPQLEILELIGHGGMGLVYKARQRKLGRLVALKVLAPHFASDAAFAERFLREAQALAKLDHPYIVTVHEYGERQGRYFIVMEFVEGKPLRELLASRQISQPDTLRLVPQICEGLHFAHEQGVVHRDIKPENILVDLKGDVRIADFGLARLVGASEDDWRLTRASQVMGTPQYMAPEQMNRPTEVDHRADIYALGAVFYEMLTGEVPMGRFALPSELGSSDKRLDNVILKSLASDPKGRYQSVQELGETVTEIRNTLHSSESSSEKKQTESVSANGRKISFHNDDKWGGLLVQNGMAGLEGEDFVIEYREVDCLQLKYSDPRSLRIPLTELSSAEFTTHWYGGGSIWITANTMTAFGRFPECKPGLIRLKFKTGQMKLAESLTQKLALDIAARFDY